VFPGAPELLDCLSNDCDSYVDEMPASEHMMVWTGCSGNNQWNDPLNWNQNRIPLASDSVIIPGIISGPLYPTLSGSIQVHTLVVEEGSTLELASMSELTVHSGPTASIAGIIIHGTLISHGDLNINNAISAGVMVSMSGTWHVYGNVGILEYQVLGLENYGNIVIHPGSNFMVKELSNNPVYNGVGAHLEVGGVLEIFK
jgi:hypothetical protein